MPPRLEITGVRKRFGATIALGDVSLTVAPGEVHALVGENGAGKSTLMKVLSGALQPDSGQLRLDGAPYAPRDPADGRRRGVAMIYQELSLAPHLSVCENILLGIEPASGPWLRRGAMRKRASTALASLGCDDIAIDAPVRTLSPGKRQLVEIARGVALGCRILVLDEPTSSLTQQDVRKLFALIGRLSASGCAVIYISHALEEVFEIAHRYTVLRDGVSVKSGAVTDTTPSDLVHAMVGRAVSDLYPRSPRSCTDRSPLLTLDRLAGLRRPTDASLMLRRGEVLGIAGLIGSGRTEMVRAIFGLDEIRSGALRVAGVSGRATPQKRWQQGAGLLSEDRRSEGLALNLTIAANTTLARQQGLGPLGFVRPSREASAARRWVDALGIKCLSAGQRVGQLSGGNQQKVALARLLHADVDLLLLDEPTRGVDVGAKAQIYALIDALAAGRDLPGVSTGNEKSSAARPRGILMISSYLPELLGVCDRIAVMCRGTLGPARPAAEWTEHALLAEATGALANSQ